MRESPSALTLSGMTTALVGLQAPGLSRVKMTTYASLVAAEVRARVARLDVTQKELAEALGVTQILVSRRMRGVVPFDVVELAAVARLLGCTITELLPAEDLDGPDPVAEVRQRRQVEIPGSIPLLELAA